MNIIYALYHIALLGLVLETVLSNEAPFIQVKSLKTTHHDKSCFTQGLFLEKNVLYESCGGHGVSSIQKVDPSSGVVLQRTPLEKKYFAEGIVLKDNRLYMLTWKNKVMLVFDPYSLKMLGLIPYATFSGQGWGFTTDGLHFIVSDGSAHINVFEFPSEGNSDGYNAKLQRGNKDYSLKKVRDLEILDPRTGRPIMNINELQYANGFIYANVWFTDTILCINASTGTVVAKFDMSELYPRHSRIRTADHFNGIAYNASASAAQSQFLVTGKLWPYMYTVNLSSELFATGTLGGSNQDL
jgi:glutaminyl-peptide cyclotransferase